jgi:hypothetical protein
MYNLSKDTAISLFKCDFSLSSLLEYYDELIHQPSLDPYEREGVLMNYYKEAIKHKRSDVLIKMFEIDGPIKETFSFMGESFVEFVTKNRFHCLSYPIFSTHSKSFDDVLGLIVGNQNKKKFLKRAGSFTKQYGTSGLNNMYILIRICGIEKFDEFINLDHNKQISCGNLLQVESFAILSQYYPSKRIFRLLTDAHYVNERELTDTISMMIVLSEKLGTALKEFLTPKPKTIRQIHDDLSKAWHEIRKSNVDLSTLPLDQEIYILNKIKFNEYEIEVPVNCLELSQISQEMCHCGESYYELIVGKMCLFLNLFKNGKRYCSIELGPDLKELTFLQIRGVHNEELSLNEEGFIKENILRIVKSYFRSLLNFE